MNKDYIKLNNAIKRNINKYRIHLLDNDCELQISRKVAIKNLWNKRKLIQDNNYIIKDVSFECIMSYGGCIPFHYVAGMKYPFKLLDRINLGLRKLPMYIQKCKIQYKICLTCPLHKKYECFNCWENLEIMKDVCRGIIKYVKWFKSIK